MKRDAFFMAKALMLARKAYTLGEVPIGAVVVSPTDEVVGGGYNKVEAAQSQVQHAEVRAIAQATRKVRSWRLEGCTVYVTVEPCLMCTGLISLSRIKRLVYGANSPLFGYHLDSESVPAIYKKHIRGITSGVLKEEAELLLRNFFKKARKDRGELRGY